MLVSCAQKTHTDKSTDQSKRQRNEITDDLIKQISNYYLESYGDSARLIENRVDTSIEWMFRSKSVKGDDNDALLLAISIPLFKEANAILYGDMDRNGTADMLLSVHTEGGGVGALLEWDDHFLFLKDSLAGYRLADVKSDWQINGCGNGYFAPEKIADGFIYGKARCYASDDGRCCPSLLYSVRVAYKDGHLSLIEKQPITH